jgi:mannosyl-oligosaccharide glucosidase
VALIVRACAWSNPELRHSCEEGDGLDSYGWTRHDGVNYGEQTIIDSKTDLKLTTTFIKHQRGTKG